MMRFYRSSGKQTQQTNVFFFVVVLSWIPAAVGHFSHSYTPTLLLYILLYSTNFFLVDFYYEPKADDMQGTGGEGWVQTGGRKRATLRAEGTPRCVTDRRRRGGCGFWQVVHQGDSWTLRTGLMCLLFSVHIGLHRVDLGAGPGV